MKRGRPRARVSPVDGTWRVHKPPGVTSFERFKEVVSELEVRAGSRLRACHGGTLDPFAEGLLLVLVGDAVHSFEALHRLPKTYVADVRWGIETDNLDPTGAVVREGTVPRAGLDEALSAFVGFTEQVPPATSAKRVGGERAYARVHRGEAVELPPSRVYLHAARWLIHGDTWSRLEIVCGGGFYVRALARDVAARLGTVAHLSRLERSRIGPYVDEPGLHHGGEPGWARPPSWPWP
ncbi:MAG: tRNA pseudouridine(55) synthase TruB [Deltaproteobacteria bacterium]|nr:tRNA pseudouridine(55) synthase TruB [Deltaproteobacteria bacterium]